MTDVDAKWLDGKIDKHYLTMIYILFDLFIYRGIILYLILLLQYLLG